MVGYAMVGYAEFPLVFTGLSVADGIEQFPVMQHFTSTVLYTKGISFHQPRTFNYSSFPKYLYNVFM